MVVEFHATVEDFADVTRRSQRRAKAAPFTTKGLLIAALIGIGAIIASTRFSSWDKAQAVAVLIVGYIAVYFFLLADYGPFYKRTIRQIYTRQLGPAWPVRVRVQLDRAGLTFAQNGIRNTTDWAAIEEIQETPDAIYFLTTDNSVMAVRKRAFETPAQLAEFLSLAHSCLKAKQNQLPSMR